MIPEQFFLKLADLDCRTVMATIIQTHGTGSGHPGSRLTFDTNNQIIGTVGGGANEQNILNHCQKLKESFQFVNTGSPSLNPLDGCTGSLTVVLEKIDLSSQHIKSFWQSVSTKIIEGRPFLLVSIYNRVTGIYYHISGNQKGPFSWSVEAPTLLEATRNQWTQLSTHQNHHFGSMELDGEEWDLLVQPLNNSARLILFGAGHVAAQTAELAGRVGFQVLVVDPRSHLCTHDNLGDHCLLFQEPYEDFFDKGIITARDFLAIMGPDHQTDFELLKMAAITEAPYIGLMGSTKKIGSFMEKLQDENNLEGLGKRLHAPIGLNIPSKSPAEVAVAIVAELITERAKLSKRL